MAPCQDVASLDHDLSETLTAGCHRLKPRERPFTQDLLSARERTRQTYYRQRFVCKSSELWIAGLRFFFKNLFIYFSMFYNRRGRLRRKDHTGVRMYAGVEPFRLIRRLRRTVIYFTDLLMLMPELVLTTRLLRHHPVIVAGDDQITTKVSLLLRVAC